jgi:hypothetical protein
VPVANAPTVQAPEGTLVSGAQDGDDD